MKQIKLFCFPYGGGSSAIYFEWKKYVSEIIDLCPIELAARGRRFGEANYDSINDAVTDVFKIIRNDIIKGPYAFFGHSLGAMISFELYYKIRNENLPLPVHIFLSGRGAPHMPREGRKIYHSLPEKEFKEEVLKFGGIPEEYRDQQELVDMILTLLRGDFKLAETYAYKKKDIPLGCDITVLSGKKDHDTREEEVEAWKIHTQKNCKIHYFEGGHFFLNKEPENVVKIINSSIKKIIPQ